MTKFEKMKELAFHIAGDCYTVRMHVEVNQEAHVVLIKKNVHVEVVSINVLATPKTILLI